MIRGMRYSHSLARFSWPEWIATLSKKETKRAVSALSAMISIYLPINLGSEGGSPLGAAKERETG